jgi:hypothetical protein
VEQTPEENMATFPSVSGGYVSIPFYSRLSKIGMGKQYIWHDSTSLKKKKHTYVIWSFCRGMFKGMSTNLGQ